MPFVLGAFFAFALIAFMCGLVALFSAYFAYRARFTGWMALRASLLGGIAGGLVPILRPNASVEQGWQVVSLLAICAIAGGLLAGIRWPGAGRKA